MATLYCPVCGKVLDTVENRVDLVTEHGEIHTLHVQTTCRNRACGMCGNTETERALRDGSALRKWNEGIECTNKKRGTNKPPMVASFDIDSGEPLALCAA